MKTTTIILALLLTTASAFSATRSSAQAAEDELRAAEAALERQAATFGAAAADAKRQVATFGAAAADAKRQVERQVAEAEHQVRHAQAQAGQTFATAGPAFKRAFGASYVNSAEPPLVVAIAPLEPAALAEVREDLTVMAKLVADAFADDHEDRAVHRAMGIVVNWLPGGAPNSNLYVEGHGVIIQTSVRFPLAPSKKEESAKPAEAPKNSAWESARRELYGGAKDETADVVFPPENREEYNADRVEALRKAILKALANASNFRRLAGNESVTVVVRNRVAPRSQLVVFHSQDTHGRTHAGKADTDGTMTIRIKKSDADGLAAGKIDEEEFRKRAQVAIY